MFRRSLSFSNLRKTLVVVKEKALCSTTVASAERDEKVLPFSKIPKIPSFPYIGSGWIYYPIIGKYTMPKLHLASIDKYHKYGPIYLEAFSQEFQVVNIYDPKDVNKVYRNETNFPDRRVFESVQKYRQDKKDLYSNGGLLTTQGEEWWDIRKQVQPHMMKPKTIQSYIGAMDEVARDFIRRMIHLRRSDGEILNYLNELYRWALESVSLVAFDARLGCVDLNPNKEAQKIISAVNITFEQMMKLEFGSIKLWKKFPSYTYKKFEKSVDYISREAFKYLQEARKRVETKSENDETTFLEQMISTSKDPRNINAMITDMIFAGVDSSGSTVGFTLYEIAKHPDVQQKLYEEIKDTVMGKQLTADTLNNLHYLKAVLKESMRLHPVAFGNMRTLQEDIILGGYAIPAGTQVLLNLYAVCQMDSYFPEAKIFKPERFMRDGVAHDPYAFLPFGVGKRSCIGRRIAEQEIWTLLVRIIEKFRVEYNYEDVGMTLRLSSAPDKPLRFQFYDR